MKEEAIRFTEKSIQRVNIVWDKTDSPNMVKVVPDENGKYLIANFNGLLYCDNMKKRQYRHRILSYLIEDGRFWFRIFGYGLAIKDTTKHKLFFSERHGFTKTLRIGKWSIKTLK